MFFILFSYLHYCYCATRANLLERKREEEESAKKAAQEELDYSGDNVDTEVLNELPDISPSALPTTESQLQPMVEVRDDTTVNDDIGAPSTTEAVFQENESFIKLQEHLPNFVAACIGIQNKAASVSSVDDENDKNDNNNLWSSTFPTLKNISEKILKQLFDSVDLFIQAIVLQAERRVDETKTLASKIVEEIDEWIGSVVAAETASVGQLRKSMLVAISSSIEVNEEMAGERGESLQTVPRVRMRYGVDVPDDGPITTIFDVSLFHFDILSLLIYTYTFF
jgi:hypothetical protein